MGVDAGGAGKGFVGSADREISDLPLPTALTSFGVESASHLPKSQQRLIKARAAETMAGFLMAAGFCTITILCVKPSISSREWKSTVG